MIKRTTPEGSMAPDPLWRIFPYGVAYDDFRLGDRPVDVVWYPMPLNYPRGWLRYLRLRLIRPPLRRQNIEMSLERQERMRSLQWMTGQRDALAAQNNALRDQITELQMQLYGDKQ